MAVSVRDGFVEVFGEDMAKAVETAAYQHAEPREPKGAGSDPFKWALCIAIGFECVSQPKFMAAHKINPEAGPAIKQWVVEHGELGSHDGDLDYLALVAGVYQDWMVAQSG